MEEPIHISGGTDQLLRSIIDGQRDIKAELKVLTTQMAALQNDWVRADEQRSDLVRRVDELQKSVDKLDGHTHAQLAPLEHRHTEIDHISTVLFGADSRGGVVARQAIVFVVLGIMAAFLTAFVSPVLVGLTVFAVQAYMQRGIP